ncbi:MAG: hypothetical protein P1U63_00740 [Coxiellaceae bacterium]|nr:hypothetical protein [Coxiellaceae bacterium]
MRHTRHGTALPGPLFTIEKTERRSKNPGLPNSIYTVTHIETGEKTAYTAEHKTSGRYRGYTFREKPPKLTDAQWRKTRYKGGGYSTIKRLTKLAGSDEAKSDSSIALPEHIALKCYTKPDTNQVEGSNQVTAAYNHQGKFAATLIHNEKFFFASEWIDGLDIVDALNARGLHTLDDWELLRLFKRLTMKIYKFHQLLGRPIGDIKPENMMGTLVNNKLMDITPIDLDNSDENTLTGEYLSEQDYQKAVIKEYRRSFASDYYGIAVTMALCSERFTDSQHLCWTTKWMKATKKTRIKCNTSRPLHTKAKATVAAEYDQTEKAIQDAFTLLVSGINPFTQPTVDLTQLQLDHDIHITQLHLRPQVRTLPTTAAGAGTSIFSGRSDKKLLARHYDTALTQLQEWITVNLKKHKSSTKKVNAILQIAQDTLFTIIPQAASNFPKLNQTLAEQAFYCEAYGHADTTKDIPLDDLPQHLDNTFRALMPCTPCAKLGCTIS